jgi:hypothetical protein
LAQVAEYLSGTKIFQLKAVEKAETYFISNAYGPLVLKYLRPFFKGVL